MPSLLNPRSEAAAPRARTREGLTSSLPLSRYLRKAPWDFKTAFRDLQGQGIWKWDKQEKATRCKNRSSGPYSSHAGNSITETT